jgi:6-pyruvoyltetrahydropterin/6-carboxytetrahydropterin synthase
VYTVSVRDHFMIAHSFCGEAFGPAQRLHGATYVVDVEFRRPELDANGMVVDIGRATTVLRETLGELNYRNLDDLPEFTGRNTTTEFLARAIFDRTVAAIARGALGDGARGVRSVRVTPTAPCDGVGNRFLACLSRSNDHLWRRRAGIAKRFPTRVAGKHEPAVSFEFSLVGRPATSQ